MVREQGGRLRAPDAHDARAPTANTRRSSISPLRSARIDDPDIVLFYGTPGQTILFVNGLQWKRYKRYDMTITGESACSDSWGRALATGETSISIPCYAERRFGGVADDEMLLAMPPDEFARGIEGLQGLGKVGLRYPIPPWGSHADPSEGMCGKLRMSAGARDERTAGRIPSACSAWSAPTARRAR